MGAVAFPVECQLCPKSISYWVGGTGFVGFACEFPTCRERIKDIIQDYADNQDDISLDATAQEVIRIVRSHGA